MAKHSHLTLSERIEIEKALRDRASFSEIGTSLGKDPSTISKEIRNHFIIKDGGSRCNPCIYRNGCKHSRDVCQSCKYQIVKDSHPSSTECINFTEYFDGFRDGCNSLFFELQEQLTLIDNEKVQVLSPTYIDSYLDKVIADVEENNGELLIAIKDGEIIGLIAGIIEPKYEIDKLTTRLPIRGIVTELVVKDGYRCNGVGKKLMDEMESYFRHRNCEFSAVNAFAPNQSAVSFYEKSGYSNRNIEMYKRLR